MDCIISLVVQDILDWLAGGRLLFLCAFSRIEVTGDLEINTLHMSVNCSDQLPHVGGIFVGNINLTLNRRRRSRVWDLLWVPHWGVFKHSYYLKGHLPPLPEPMNPGFGGQLAP